MPASKGTPRSERDSAYDTQDFVAECRARGITPHVAQKKNSAIDGRTTRHPGYQASQTVRKRIEQVYGWLKTFGGFRKTRYKGRAKTELYGLMAAQRIQPTPNGKADGRTRPTRAPGLSAVQTAAVSWT